MLSLLRLNDVRVVHLEPGPRCVCSFGVRHRAIIWPHLCIIAWPLTDHVGYESTAKAVARSTERPVGKALLVALICCRVMWWGTTGDCEQVCRESKTPRTYTR